LEEFVNDDPNLALNAAQNDLAEIGQLL